MSSSNDAMVMVEEIAVKTKTDIQKTISTTEIVADMQKETKVKATLSEQNHVTISPPKEDIVDDDEMEEVDYRTLYKQKLIKDSDRDKIEGLAGIPQEKALDILAKMKDTGVISGFREVPLGAHFLTDYVSDRVQVFIDKVGNVANIRIG